MLKAIICEQDIDFLSLQGVAVPVTPSFTSYYTYVNLGTTHRGMAVITATGCSFMK
jgi:hypothetical protein